MSERLTYWNCKEKGSALPVGINDDGDTVDLETLCAKLAAYEDTGLEPSEIKDLHYDHNEFRRFVADNARLRAELDELRAHHAYPTTELANTKDLNDKMPIAAELISADYELRARITEGISIERLMEMCEGEQRGKEWKCGCV